MLQQASSQSIDILSGELVGFWKSEAIRLAVEMNVLEDLTLAHPIFLRALWEIGVVEKDGKGWKLTEKGQLLTSNSFMGEAALMWGEVQKVWENLPQVLKEPSPSHHLTFKERCTEEEKLEVYRKAIAGYSRKDFSTVAKAPMWSQHQKLMILGQVGMTLAQELITNHPSIEAIVLNQDLPLYKFVPSTRLQAAYQDPLSPWGLEGDALILPRFLDSFPDKEALQILKRGYQALTEKGALYIFEMVIDYEKPMGGLMELNMLVETGGKLRSREEWKFLLKEASFKVTGFQEIKPYLHLIKGEKA